MKINLLILLLSTVLLSVSASTSYSDDEAGRVLTVKKNVYLIRDDERTDAKPQMILEKNDAVETDKNSRTKIFFNDDSILNLGELSRVEIDEYLYNSEKERSKSIYKLMEGSLRVVVGRSDLEIHTPTAVVAARGTMFVVWIETSDTTGAVTTHAMVFDGDITLSSLLAGIEGFVDVGVGQTGSVPPGSVPDVRPATPDEILQFQDTTDVIGEFLDGNDIPVQLENVDVERIIRDAEGDDDDDSGPPTVIPEIRIIDQVPSEALTDVTIDVQFPPEN